MTASDLTRSVTRLARAARRRSARGDDVPVRRPGAVRLGVHPRRSRGPGVTRHAPSPARRRDGHASCGTERVAARARQQPIIALETVLGGIERESGRGNWPRRDPMLYWFAVFGDPSASDGAPWMWRVGGHHVAIHVTVADGRRRGQYAVIPRREPGDRSPPGRARGSGHSRGRSSSPASSWPDCRTTPERSPSSMPSPRPRS